MIVPYIPVASESSASPSGGLVLEVDLDVFTGLIKQNEKPVVLEHHAGFPKTYRYYVRLGEFYFLYRNRERQNFAAHANILPVKGIFAGPGSVV